MSRVVALIQARMGSSRFPGKMLARLGGLPLLEWVLCRVGRAGLLDDVVLATSDLDRDTPLAALAEQFDVKVYRGSEKDVLARFAAAASTHHADIVVRICADNPFIDPAEIDRLVAYFRGNALDYACNHQDRLGSGYADGFGAEILTNGLLQKIASGTADPRHREHATLFLWEHASEYRLGAVRAPKELAHPQLRFDVDEAGHLNYLESLVKEGVSVDSTAAEIVAAAQGIRRSDTAAPFGGVGKEIDTYLKRLFPLCRSITGEPNRESLRILQEIIPLTIREVPSGEAVYDWVIPEEWTIRDAWIADATGRRVVDFKANNLHVVSYSVPVGATMSWSELEPHIHRHPELPDAIPYRTTYYTRNWGFCVTHAQYDELARTAGPLTVVVDSELKSGSLTYGEFLIPGRSKTEILLSCYICHPSMANDSLSGVLLTAFLARHISMMKDRHWSYRVIFVPETIGAIAYCALNQAAMEKIDIGLVITTVGGAGPWGYKQTWQPEHPLNAIIESVFADMRLPFKTYSFDIHGSDERQYSSQGFRINAATICRDRYYEYPYYHTSKDDLQFVTAGQISESLEIYQRLIQKLEARRIYRSAIPHCEPMLSRHGLYPKTGGVQRPELGGRSELDMILWVLFLSDGRISVEDMAGRLNVKIENLEPCLDKLLNAGILVRE